MRYPEKLEITSSITSEATIFGRRRPQTFLVGKPMSIEGEVRNTGTTPMPFRDPSEWGGWWSLDVRVAWSDGRITELESRFQRPLKPGESVRFGPFRTSVVSSGFFHVELRHPDEEWQTSPDGKSGGGRSGTENYVLMEAVAVDMNAIYSRWGFWITLATLGLVVLGLFVGVR